MQIDSFEPDWEQLEAKGDAGYSGGAISDEAVAKSLRNYILALDKAKEAKTSSVDLARLRRKIGRCYCFQSRYQEAQVEYNKGLQVISSSPQSQEVIFERARLYLEQANCFMEESEINKADAVAQKAHDLLRELDLLDVTAFQSEVGQIYNLLGIFAWEKHDREQFRKWMTQAERAFFRAGDVSRELSVGLNLHKDYLLWGDYQRAIDYYESNLSRFIDKRPGAISKVHLNLAVAYTEVGEVQDLDTAIQHARASFRQSHDPVSQIYACEAWAEALKEKAAALIIVNKQEALVIAEEAREVTNTGKGIGDSQVLAETNEFKQYLFQIYRIRAECNLAMGDLAKAEEELKKADAIGLDADLEPGLKETFYGSQALLKKKQGQFTQALKLLDQAIKGATKWGMLGKVVRFSIDTARIQIELGEKDQATKTLRESLDLAHQTRRQGDEAVIKDLIDSIHNSTEKSVASSLAERDSLQHQLDEVRANLKLIEERIAEFVLSVDVPLQLVKERRRLQDRIAELEQKLGQ